MSCPASTLSKVVFPEPEEPMIASNLPGFASPLTFDSRNLCDKIRVGGRFQRPIYAYPPATLIGESAGDVAPPDGDRKHLGGDRSLLVASRLLPLVILLLSWQREGGSGTGYGPEEERRRQRREDAAQPPAVESYHHLFFSLPSALTSPCGAPSISGVEPNRSRRLHAPRVMAGGRWLFPLVSVSFVAVLLVLSAISGFIASSAFFAGQPDAADVHRGAAHPPAFAYYISGGRGDASRMIRLLLAVYHPRNRYLLHISADAPNSERADLAIRVRLSMPAIRAFENVDVVGKASAMTPMGSSELAARLHAASVLLRLDGSWDWFVTLNAADYPLVTQDGSPWVILSRSFIEYSVLGWDNLPRTLLLYFTNVILSQESYFHSVMCNSPDFQNTTINSNLRYMVWDNPPKMEPHFLNMTDFDRMIESGMPFARQFHQDDPVLDKIDDKVLGRRHHQAVPGAWCSGRKRWWADPCSHWSNANIMGPGPQAEKFGRVMKDLLDKWKSDSRSCKSNGSAVISS
ncbi:hypothetical protein GW17_00001970 [Ensete ventricosum]|nr:hypothetical protein GW17_00001970 [Ensete ventricosum]